MGAVTTNRDYRFDVQLKEGLAAEAWFYEMTSGGDRFEVKHDKKALDTRRVYVETEHDPGATGEYVPSGITTTEADCWIFVLGEPKRLSFVGVEVDRLRELANASTRTVEQPYGSCPTRGKLVPLGRLVGLATAHPT